MSEYDFGEDSDDDFGSSPKTPGSRPTMPAMTKPPNKKPQSMGSKKVHFATTPTSEPSISKTTKPTTSKPTQSGAKPSQTKSTDRPNSKQPTDRPNSKPPERPSKPPAVPANPPNRPVKPPSGKKKDPEIKAIMEAMDRELAGTEVGKSFERMTLKVFFFCLNLI